MKKSFVYEYENTLKRRIGNAVENFVNWALLLTATAIIFSGVMLAIIHLAFGV
tara:strand:+ start:129 stop:287 length:159 start_codon:yes stop_codon:yes gene_type:complete